MNIQQWFILFLIAQLIHGLGTWKMYVAAGRKPWEAFVPVYNAYVLTKIINRSWWWVLLLFVPMINVIMFGVVWVETARSFGKYTKTHTFLTLVTLGFYLYYLNYATDLKYEENRSLKARTATGDLISAIVFAVVAATLIHTYVMQPFTIPTSSLEKTLLVGDFLLVSKMHYGARTPTTAVSFPMVHDTIPFFKVKSYLSWPQLPYFRLPGFQDIKRNDIVVFNWPVDTVRYFRDQSNIHAYKPLDKKSNYVKRAVGIPGDSLSIQDGYVYINGQKEQLPERARLQFSYVIETNGQPLGSNFFERYEISDGASRIGQNQIQIHALTEAYAAQLKSHPAIANITRLVADTTLTESSIFPNNGKFNWNRDQFGTVYIPKAGDEIQLNRRNFSIYRYAIEAYENNTLTWQDGQAVLNGKPASSYTFKQDYYWMMGDNRHNSEDSRYWGFVPFDHVVGKPVFVWMSIEGITQGFSNWKPRWNRFFTTVSGSGEPVSYFKYFLIAIGLWFVISKLIRRKQKKA
ncbi:MAG: signal peptidase I [Bacteroidetes bacterium]|nr:signal peptidase I [Bacteroidota bacterium]